MSATATMGDATLADFDDDFVTAKPGGFKRGDFDLSELPDNDYEFNVVSAEIKKGGAIFELTLELLTECPQAGGKINQAYFFTKKNNQTGMQEKNLSEVGKVKADLAKLGFDTDNWTPETGRKFSTELPKVPLVIQGMRVVMTKKTGGKKSATENYHNLYVKGRGANDGKPEKIDAKYLEEANVDPLG